MAISVQGLNFSHFRIISLCSINFFSLQLLSFTPLRVPLEKSLTLSLMTPLGLLATAVTSLVFSSPGWRGAVAPAIPHSSPHSIPLPITTFCHCSLSSFSEYLLLLGGPKAGQSASTWGPHECWMEDKSHFHCSAGDPPVMQPPSLLLPWTLMSFSAELPPCWSTHNLSCGCVTDVLSSLDLCGFLHLVKTPLELLSFSLIRKSLT